MVQNFLKEGTYRSRWKRVNKTANQAAVIFAAARNISPAASGQVKRDASEPNAQLPRAAELLRVGNLDEAEPILRQVLAANPKNADAHNLLGVILDQRGKTPEAELEYR